jgi:hypothetical protein
MAAVEQRIAYQREVCAGDALAVETTLVEVRDKVLKFVHRMVVPDTGETAAVMLQTTVHLDTDQRRSTALPADVLARARPRRVVRAAVGCTSIGARDGSCDEARVRALPPSVAAGRRRRTHLQLRVHVLRPVRRHAGALPQLRRRARRAPAARSPSAGAAGVAGAGRMKEA